jgi:pimeloyl-ACP methyl ester carboxylesterase
MNLLPIVLAILIAQAPAPGPESAVRRIDMGEAILVLPEGFRPRGERADLMIHMHGGEPAVEKAQAESGWQGALLIFNRKGLSSVYTEPFRDPALLPRLLEKARKEIANAWPTESPKIGRVFVSSFSAGFGGVRELLAVADHFSRIDGVILADSLYAGYQGEIAKRRIDPAKMVNFRRFAAEAAAGRKTMIVTYSALIPDGYASTAETADDLIGHVGGRATSVDVDEDWGDGWRLKRRCAKGRFLVLGFAGLGPDDHMRHLRQLGKIWRAAIDVDVSGAGKSSNDRDQKANFSQRVLSGHAHGQGARSVDIAVGKNGDVPVAEIVARLARVSGLSFERPAADLTLSTQGLARALTKTLLSEALGPEVAIDFRPGTMVMTVDGSILTAEKRGEWLGRLGRLADRANEAASKRQSYGMYALKSYHPNDPARPTVCLVHGLNSSSRGFVHMVPWLEEAGYGIVVYDYPFNRSIAQSCQAFARDWSAFRGEINDKLPWSIVAHSMGALLARSLAETDAEPATLVRSLIMIAPVNQGSQLAKVQTVVQLMNGLKAINGKNTAKAMMNLSDGLGQAALDMLPGSPFLNELNRRPRRPGLSYHIVAGDRGFLTREGRAQIEGRLDLVTRTAGILGQLTQAATADLPDLLNELCDGTGDGCVSVARTRLDGVADHVTIHANHAELIRAPLLFADPGPVACMPDVLRWLTQDQKR